MISNKKQITERHFQEINRMSSCLLVNSYTGSTSKVCSRINCQKVVLSGRSTWNDLVRNRKCCQTQNVSFFLQFAFLLFQLIRFNLQNICRTYFRDNKLNNARTVFILDFDETNFPWQDRTKIAW